MLKAGPYRGFSTSISSIAFSDDGKALVSAADERVIVWNVATGKEIMSDECVSPFLSVAFRPGGKNVASLNSGGLLFLWDVATGKFTAIVEHPSGHRFAKGVAFTPNGDLLAAGCYGAIAVWHVAAPANQRSLTTKAAKTKRACGGGGAGRPPGSGGDRGAVGPPHRPVLVSEARWRRRWAAARIPPRCSAASPTRTRTSGLRRWRCWPTARIRG